MSVGRRSPRRRTLAVALGLVGLVGLVGLLAACEPAAPAATPLPPPSLSPSATPSPSASDAGDTFRYAIREPGSIVPGDAVDPDGLMVVDAVFDSLTSWAAEGTVQPAAAARWDVDPTATVFTFFLRRGATFHGPGAAPVTADDFVFSWTRAVAQGEAGYHLRDVLGYDALADGATDVLEGVTAVDALTLEVRLSRPMADFPTVVGHPSLGPLPRAAFTADPGAFAEQPVGNGPFAMAAPWAHGQFLRLAPAPRWQIGPAPALAQVLFQVSDVESAYVAFQQGRRDVAPLPAGETGRARERYGTAAEDGSGLVDGPTGQLYFLGMDLDAPPFDQVDVRRALSLAVDRDALARTAGDSAAPATAVVPPGVPGSRPRPCDACRYAPEEARRLFAEAGVDRLELWLSRGGGHEQIAEQLVTQLAEVGVELMTRVPEPATGGDAFPRYLAALRDGEASLFRFGWSVDYPTLDNALRPLLSGAVAGRDGFGNYGGLADPQVDALLDQARSTVDPADRRRLYWEAEDVAMDELQAIVPLLTFRQSVVVGERVEGFRLSPLGLADLADVRLTPAAPDPA